MSHRHQLQQTRCRIDHPIPSINTGSAAMWSVPSPPVAEWLYYLFPFSRNLPPLHKGWVPNVELSALRPDEIDVGSAEPLPSTIKALAFSTRQGQLIYSYLKQQYMGGNRGKNYHMFKLFIVMNSLSWLCISPPPQPNQCSHHLSLVLLPSSLLRNSTCCHLFWDTSTVPNFAAFTPCDPCFVVSLNFFHTAALTQSIPYPHTSTSLHAMCCLIDKH